MCFCIRAPRTPKLKVAQKNADDKLHNGAFISIGLERPQRMIYINIELGGAGGSGSKNVRGAFISTTPVAPATFIFKINFIRKHRTHRGHTWDIVHCSVS